MGRWTKTLAERFWEKVSKGGPVHPVLGTACWAWTASTNPNGYGKIFVAGRLQVASRVSWEMHNGPIPDGLFVLHHCDNPLCVRPAHLFLGTCADNVRDMWSKGRAVTIATLYASRDTCPNGHHYDAATTRILPNGGRRCLICRKASSDTFLSRNRERRYERKRARRLAANGGVSRARADRTHCPHGHAYDDANTRRRARGHRDCRACDAARAREKRRRLRGDRATRHTDPTIS